ncbi:DNA repair protein RecN [Isoalcanivorax pacificus W11-5]|uniref:DNA repair protein RecN n=1 Tax=Isoalcanivorax pacificus W11-5 TaxID=391936 RepID=A0A0B4XMW4_9GAMM|nr:DNA repair protein RecN [Isoalcanivorax pacificus]AJD49734.1 DNA repair protein RecN [Isoalcanivorax pacificus W11-5]
MLTHLSVLNFATVDSLELEPARGLTVITGETGAGKSVIIDALGLALGERADSAVVRPDCERAEVQATFDLRGHPAARTWLAERELDNGEECMLRRTVRPDGRSRAWINGSPMPLQEVRELGDMLISVHSQHEHQALLRREVHRSLLDSFAGAGDLAETLREHWRAWHKARRALDEAMAASREQHEREELLRFQLEELDALALGENELDELEGDQKRLGHAEELIRLCQQSLALLFEHEEGTVNDQLGQALNWLGDASSEDPALGNIFSTVESARLQVEAAADDLRHYLDRLDVDPERLAQVDERLSQVYTLARKHRVRPEELYQRHQQLREEAHTLAHYDEHLAGLEAAEKQARDTYDHSARALSERRRSKAGELASGVISHLKALGMRGARLDVSLTATEPGPDGLEIVEFLFTANPGQPLRPLAKVASGGELSRVSLAIQVICAKVLTVPSLVFDEVDVGVGGGVAEIVGRLLRELGEHAQVLCITHQPQVAAQGHQHWHVHKKQSKTSTHTRIQSLTMEHRTSELARMLGGLEMTDSTLAHAREMLEKAQA